MDFPSWSYAGMHEFEQYKINNERKTNAAIRKRFIQSLQSGSSKSSGSTGSTSVRAPKRSKKTPKESVSNESEDIPDLDDVPSATEETSAIICQLCDDNDLKHIDYKDDNNFKKHLINDHFRDELLKRHICAQKCPYCQKTLGNADPYAKIIHIGSHKEVLNAMYQLALKNKNLKKPAQIDEGSENVSDLDISDLEEGTKESFSLGATSTPKSKANDKKSDLEKRMLELERENAKLKYERDELKKENAQMSGSWGQMKSVRNLLVAKIKLCNPEEDEESLLKKNSGYLITKFESSINQPTSTSQVEKLKERVKQLEEKKKSLKEKLKIAKSSKPESDDFKSLKEDLMNAVNNKDNTELRQVRQERDRAHIEINHLRESLSEIKTKLRLQREINEEHDENIKELKNVLELPEQSHFSFVIKKVKDLKDKNYEKEEAADYTHASDTINELCG